MQALSDPELERRANDRISFLKFPGFPEKIPDQSTIWYFRERLIKHKKPDLIREELRRQENVLGLKIKKRYDPGCCLYHGRSGPCPCG
jgi:IS5 family transposase